MSKGSSGLFHGTRGDRAFPGSTDYMRPGDRFSQYIRRRPDVDTNGFYDVIAHGSPTSILIQHNGVTFEIDHRIAARLLSQDKNYHGGAIRLLSCSTGKLDSGFAQNLANKLNVPVQAPTDILWASPSGKHYVAAGTVVKGKLVEDRSKMGSMKTFYPQRRMKK